MHRANPTSGSPPDPRRAAEARFHSRAVDSVEVPTPPSQASLAELADFVRIISGRPLPSISRRADRDLRLLYVFVVLSLERRRLLHVHVTAHPTAAWTAQQMVEALPDETNPRYSIRDRDGIYGAEFRRRVAGLGLREVLIAPHSPWQNPYAERFIGSLRRECLDHMIVLNERQASRILSAYARCYNCARTRLALDKDAPASRRIQGRELGRVIAFREVGGLHHRYERVTASSVMELSERTGLRWVAADSGSACASHRRGSSSAMRSTSPASSMLSRRVGQLGEDRAQLEAGEIRAEAESARRCRSRGAGSGDGRPGSGRARGRRRRRGSPTDRVGRANRRDGCASREAFEVLHRRAAELDNRRSRATDDLLHGGRHEARVHAELAPLVGVLDQRSSRAAAALQVVLRCPPRPAAGSRRAARRRAWARR